MSFYCSELSRNAGEPLYGSASRATVWLMLEHPHAWGRKALESSQLPDNVKEFLRSTLKSVKGSRFQLIRRSYSQSEKLNFFVAVTHESSPIIRHIQLDSYDDLLSLNINQIINEPVESDNSPLYIICTDGKHDKCCAKFGTAVYKSLKEKFGDAVWESSHVGGDRFAANMVCFPHGLYFGRMSNDEAIRVVSEYEEGRVLLSKFRGRSSLSSIAQVGEYLIRLQSGNISLNALQFLHEEELSSNEYLVKFGSVDDGIIHTVKFSAKNSDIAYFMTCDADEEKSFHEYELLDYSTEFNIEGQAHGEYIANK